MKQYHIVFFENGDTDYYSKGITYTSKALEDGNELLDIASVMMQWNSEFPLEQYPKRKLAVLYPIS